MCLVAFKYMEQIYTGCKSDEVSCSLPVRYWAWAEPQGSNFWQVNSTEQQHALTPLHRRSKGWQNSLKKRKFVWLGVAQGWKTGLWEKGQKLPSDAELVSIQNRLSDLDGDEALDTTRLDETQITNLCRCCFAVPCNGGSCGISPCAPRGSCAACNFAHSKRICEVFRLHKQTNK